jgi:putative Ca2+/H+ antiporter (TMEM165/GDT1 family)
MKRRLVKHSLVLLMALVLETVAAREGPGGMAKEKAEKHVNPGFSSAFAKAFMMILVTEIGDETFIIAAIMAMRHSRYVVYGGAMAALILMTVLSTLFGFVLPNFLSKSTTNHVATGLYIFFGVRLFWIAYKSDPNEAKEEVVEVEEKLAAGETAVATKWKRLFLGLLTPVFREALVSWEWDGG